MYKMEKKKKKKKKRYPIWYPIMNTRVFLQNIIRCCRKAAANIFCKPIIFDEENLRRIRGEEKTKDVQVEEKKNKTTRPKLWVFCFVIFIFFSSTLTIIMIYNTAEQRLDR